MANEVNDKVTEARTLLGTVGASYTMYQNNHPTGVELEGLKKSAKNALKSVKDLSNDLIAAVDAWA